MDKVILVAKKKEIILVANEIIILVVKEIIIGPWPPRPFRIERGSDYSSIKLPLVDVIIIG